MTIAFVLAVVRLCDASFWTTVQSKRLWSVYAMQAFRPQSSRSACGPSIRYKLSDHSPIAAPVVRLCDASFWTTVQSKRLWSVYAVQAFGPQSRVQSRVKVRWSARFVGKIVGRRIPSWRNTSVAIRFSKSGRFRSVVTIKRVRTQRTVLSRKFRVPQ